MKQVKIQIDDKEITAPEGKTILQICREQNIDIPTLCHDDQLEPFTSCFLCVVQVEGARGLVPSCSTKIRPGMKITTWDQKIEAARKMALELILSNHYADCLGPCKITCPAGVDVQGYLALAAMGKYYDAIKLIKNNNPLPTVCGRVCTRPCEMNCRRNFVDETTAIDHVKRFIADFDLESPDRFFPPVKPDTGLKVAIIGAGPAGLSCAYYLRQEGHTVEIFDAKSKAGGMLRWGIPQYRLPEEILDKEIRGITELGVNIHLNNALGRDFSIDSLFEQNYKAIFLGLGAQGSSSMRVENENSPGVLSGIDFLEDVKLKKYNSLQGRVAVIGGGNTAMDAARSALRLGADEVTILYRRTMKEMPANQIEIEEAQDEGIKFELLTAPLRVVLNEEGRTEGLECVRMKLGEPDTSGRRRPIPVSDSNFVEKFDWVIAAIGQKPDLAFAAKDGKLVNISMTKWGTLEVQSDTMETNIPGVFTGGDVVLGPASAIEAIAHGRNAAMAIHLYISGKKLELPPKPFISRKENFKKLTADDFASFPKITREKMAVRDPEKRKFTWKEVEIGFTEEQVYHEALRCLSCGCQAFYDCDLQKHSTDYQANQTNFTGDFLESAPDSSHPFIRIELNKCILCGRCVRMCDEVMGLGVFGFVKRGFDAKVKPMLEMPLAETHCISCGQCVETCPTGAIVDKVDAAMPGPWMLEQHPTVCQYCSVGCEMNADVLDQRVLKISAKQDTVVNEFGNLCINGRYGFRYVNSETRLTQPLIRKEGELTPVSWKEALDFAANQIKKRRSAQTEWAVFSSPHATNEENYLLQKLARTALQTNNLGSFSDTSSYPPSLLKSTFADTTFSRIEESDFLVVVGFDPMETHPVVYIKLQKAARRGQRVLVVGKPTSRLALKTTSLNVRPENLLQLFQYVLLELVKNDSTVLDELKYQNAPLNQWKLELPENPFDDFEINEGEFEDFLQSLLNSENPLFICQRKEKDTEFFQLMNLLKKALGKTEFCLSLPEEINFRGMLDMGINPNFLPGYNMISHETREVFRKIWKHDVPAKPGAGVMQQFAGLSDGQIQNAIFWGQDPVGAGKMTFEKSPATFIIVADMFLTKTAKLADVVFPLAPFFEINGSITNAEGRVQQFTPAVRISTELENWQILTEFANRLKLNWGFTSARDIFSEICEFFPDYKEGLVSLKEEIKPYVQVKQTDEQPAVPFGANYLQEWFGENFSDQQKKAVSETEIFDLKTD